MGGVPLGASSRAADPPDRDARLHHRPPNRGPRRLRRGLQTLLHPLRRRCSRLRPIRRVIHRRGGTSRSVREPVYVGDFARRRARNATAPAKPPSVACGTPPRRRFHLLHATKPDQRRRFRLPHRTVARRAAYFGSCSVRNATAPPMSRCCSVRKVTVTPAQVARADPARRVNEVVIAAVRARARTGSGRTAPTRSARTAPSPRWTTRQGAGRARGRRCSKEDEAPEEDSEAPEPKAEASTLRAATGLASRAGRRRGGCTRLPDLRQGQGLHRA